MKNNELIHYLNSEVKVQDNEDNNIYSLYGVSLAGGSELLLLDKNSRVVESSFYSATPYLYPLSCLTETINHEGVDEIPLVELAKIEGTYKGEEYSFLETQMTWDDKDELLDCHFFWYNDILKSFCRYTSIQSVHCKNQRLLFDYLDSRRINHRGITNAIDPRTLDVNPYKI